ncbi:MAG: single-stranded DNA-binding protein [Sphaerochaetaceae bacterium]|nr:single-stranded DNA-binding protein [Sphaerochaetaceae bacterium]
MSFSSDLIELTRTFSDECSALELSFDGYIYNPLSYAWDNHRLFLEKYVKSTASVLFLGMNPGPYGMMQNGVPFGEVETVRDYLKCTAKIGKPEREHPGRPVLGLDCPKSEVSGKRLWGLFKSAYPCASDFADTYCVFNYCPLGFLLPTPTAKNATPDLLPASERKRLEELCDRYLENVINLVNPSYLIGVGKYAEKRILSNPASEGRTVSSIIHPSPGNPQANRGWQEKTEEKLRSLGIWK